MWDIEVLKKINSDAATAVQLGLPQRVALESALEHGMSPTKMLWFTADGKPPKDND